MRFTAFLIIGLTVVLAACGKVAGPEPLREETPTPAPLRATPGVTASPNPGIATPGPEVTASNPTPTPTAVPTTPIASHSTEAVATVTKPFPDPAKRYPLNIEPAFPGLPRLKLPVALVDVPKHDLFLIALQDGLVLSVPRGGPYDNPRIVHDQRDRTLRYAYEEGFLALALDPSFDQNGYVYAYYSYSPGPEERSTRLVRFATTGEGDTFTFDADSEFVILEIPQPNWNHNGGSLVFGPDGMLYLGIGDGGGDGDPQGNGQNPGTLLGTVIRIDVRNPSAEQPYSIPPDNPMVTIEGARPEVWAYGFRNPWRLSFDAETRLLWAADVGHYHAEEVNIVRPGENYGWNITEGTSCFPQDQTCDLAGLTLPVWEYGRSSGCAVIGGYVYRGNEVPSIVGRYVFADYCTGRVWGIHAGTAAAGESVESLLLADSGLRFILSLAEDASGEIYLLIGEEESKDRIYCLVAR